MDNMYEKLMKSLAVWCFVMLFIPLFFFCVVVNSSILFFIYAIAFRLEILTFLQLSSVASRLGFFVFVISFTARLPLHSEASFIIKVDGFISFWRMIQSSCWKGGTSIYGNRVLKLLIIWSLKGSLRQLHSKKPDRWLNVIRRLNRRHK